MANAVASMAGLRGASQVVLEGAFVISSSTRVPSRSNISGRRVGASGKPGVVAVRAQQSEEGRFVPRVVALSWVYWQLQSLPRLW